MIEAIGWLLLGALHLTPAIAFFRPSLLARLYGVEAGGTVFTLLRHRAALFVLVVAICGFAAFDPGSRRVATIAVAISMGSFLFLFVGAGRPSVLRTVAIADAAGLVVLAFVGWRAFG